MVGPKINHHFLQLPLAVNRAKYPRHLQLAGQELSRAQIVVLEILHHRLAILRIIQRILIRHRVSGLSIRIPIRIRCPRHFTAHRIACLRCGRAGRIRATLHTIVTGRCQVRRQRTAALKLLQQLARLRIFFVKLRRGHTQRFQILKFGFRGRVVNLVRRQLLFDVLVHAHRLHAFDVARPGAKAKPVQNMKYPLIFAEPGRFARGSSHALRAYDCRESCCRDGDDGAYRRNLSKSGFLIEISSTHRSSSS